MKDDFRDRDGQLNLSQEEADNLVRGIEIANKECESLRATVTRLEGERDDRMHKANVELNAIDNMTWWELRAEVKRLEGERNVCRNSVVETTIHFPNVGEYIRQLEGERDALKKENKIPVAERLKFAALSEGLATREKEVECFRAILDRLAASITGFVSVSEGFGEQANRIQAYCEKQANDVASLRATVTRLEGERDALETANAGLERYCRQIQSELDRARDELCREIKYSRELRPELDRARKEIKWLRTPSNVIIMLDGKSWCAFRGDFINLQESIAGFGDAPGDAYYQLTVEEIKAGNARAFTPSLLPAESEVCVYQQEKVFKGSDELRWVGQCDRFVKDKPTINNPCYECKRPIQLKRE